MIRVILSTLLFLSFASVSLAQSVVNVKSIAACNGVTDDTTALQTALTGMTSGTLYFPGCFARTTAVLTASANINFVGDNAHTSGLKPDTAASGILFTGSNPPLLEHFGVVYGSGGAAGTFGIKMQSTGSQIIYPVLDDVFVFGAYNCLELLTVELARIDGFNGQCIGSDGIRIANNFAPDAGDSTVVNSSIFGVKGTTNTLIVQEGGVRFTNSKINGATIGVLVQVPSGVNTSDVFIEGNSIEGISSVPVYFQRAGATGSLGHVVIDGNELGGGTFGVFAPVDVNGAWLSDIDISHNRIILDAGPVCYGAYIASGSNATLLGNTVSASCATNYRYYTAPTWAGAVVGQSLGGGSFTPSVILSTNTTTYAPY